jgi:hypothetical protein
MRGEGAFATLFSQRFELARRKHGFDNGGHVQLDTSGFVPPALPGSQMALL